MSDERTALVTGASSGIGAAVAVELGGLGWRVGLGARRVDRLEETAAAVRDAGGTAFAHALDVTDADSVAAWFVAVEAELGPVDALVNNAGMATPGWLHRTAPDAIKREVETNLLGPILTSQILIATLRERGARGDIVFITSDATRHARPRMATYTATKAGLEALAHCVALECEGTGIRSTVVRVGPTTSTEFGTGWPIDELEDLMTYWLRFGLHRHNGLLDPEAIARAVAMVLTAPPGVRFDTIEVQPEAPVDDDRAGQIIERPTARTRE